MHAKHGRLPPSIFRTNRPRTIDDDTSIGLGDPQESAHRDGALTDCYLSANEEGHIVQDVGL